MNVDHILEQIEYHNKNYEWIVKESEKCCLELKQLDKNKYFDAEKYDVITKRFMELENRFARNKKEYDEVVSQVREYFNDKHGIDIIGLLEDDIDEAK